VPEVVEVLARKCLEKRPLMRIRHKLGGGGAALLKLI
jgi:hypothetical protein